MTRLPRRAVEIANEVQLLRAQHKGAFLLTEGRDDRLLYTQFVDMANCQVVVADGKENVEGAVHILDDQGVRGVVGIVDSDLERIVGVPTRSTNICVGDNHDLETMLMLSSAFDRVLTEYASQAKVTALHLSARELIFSAAIPIGQLRLISHRNNLNLDFDSIEYSRFVMREDLSVDLHELVRLVSARSKVRLPDTHEMVKAMNQVGTERLAVEELCCGTDLIAVFGLALQRAIGTMNSSEVTPSHLRRVLRLAYPVEEFYQSSVGKFMATWSRSQADGYTLLNPD